MTDLHARFTARLPAYFADALSEPDHAWLEQHRSECAECAMLFARIAARLPELRDDAGHAPVSVLADLASADSPLTSLERKLVLQHLEHCAACMTEAQALGYAARARAIALPLWLWRTGFAAAAALALFVAIRRDVTAPTPIPVPAVAHTTAPVAAPTTSRLVLEEPTRGAATPVAVALVDSTTRTLAIELPTIFLADSNAVLIRIVDTAGAQLVRQVTPAAALARPIVLDAPIMPWQPGRYRVELSPNDHADRAGVRRFEFELRRRRP